MPKEQVLADTSFVYAIFDTTDNKHRLTFNIVNASQIQLIIPDVVLTETNYLLKDRIGMNAVIKCLDGLIAAQIPLEPILSNDLKRIRDITEKYSDAHFDFVDTCIMAMAERLNITKICTFDHRDFNIFRPTHCEYLELLP